MHEQHQQYEALGCLVAETEDDVRALAADVIRASRRQPIVCLTARRGDTTPALDPAQVRHHVGT